MLCCIFNYAPHYRLPIYSGISKEFNAHFYFGERLNNEIIKKIDFKQLEGFQKELKVNFYSFPICWEWRKGMINLAFNKKYDKYLITPNVIAPYQWIFLLICYFFKKEVYTWEHGIKSHNVSKRYLSIHKAYFRMIRGSFIYGDKARINMIHLGYDKNKLHTIYNSLDYDFAIKLRKDLKEENIYKEHFNNNNSVLLFIGRLTKTKNLDILVHAHNVLDKKGIYTNVVIIGDGEMQKDLIKMVKSLGISDKYWFYGPVYEEEVIAKLLFNATLCVSPGNVGLTAIHSLSYGLPVITTDNYEIQMPEHEAITNGKNGLFYKDEDASSLADTIEKWLNFKADRNRIREDCYEPIDNLFNSSNQIQIFKRVIFGENNLDVNNDQIE